MSRQRRPAVVLSIKTSIVSSPKKLVSNCKRSSFIYHNRALTLTMEWVISPGPNKIRVAHFDVAGTSPPLEQYQAVEACEDHLGAVYWKEAVELFVPFLGKELKKQPHIKRVLCLGEGPGASGLGLAASKQSQIKRIVLTDLSVLKPLMDFNLSMNPQLKETCRVWPLDWMDEQALFDFKKAHYDCVIGCEVLYGNRFTWPGLKRVLEYMLKSGGVAYFCVTFRNGRKDVDDFCGLLSDGFVKKNEWELIEGHMVVFKIQKS
jgi:hypothetical protein